MRLFQNYSVYRTYRPRLARITAGEAGFAAKQRVFLHDRFGAVHFLVPILAGDPDAFFTNGGDAQLQKTWAREQGMPAQTALSDILLAQIEAHRADIFYNLDPMRYGDSFIARLPGCVKRTIAWRAAPSAGGAFLRHDVIVNNFPGLLAGYRAQGANTAYFAPAFDPEMAAYAENTDRPIDILFVGSYSRHHRQRAVVLERIAALNGRYAVSLHLEASRMTQLAESPLGLLGPLKAHRRPAIIRQTASGPIFGRDLYAALSRAKIVVNGAIDMSGTDRGNMRCWEAMGCGAHLLTDAGNYPEGMRAGETMSVYRDEDDLLAQLSALLAEDERRTAIAAAGHAMLRNIYSKERQWSAFEAICAGTSEASPASPAVYR